MQPTRYASFLKRFVAFVIDGFISASIGAMLFLPLLFLFIPKWLYDAALTGWLRNHDFKFPHFGTDLVSAGLSLVWNIALLIFIMILISWLYFALFESSSNQATPGKMLMGIFVTDLQGRRISFQRALGRTLAKILSKAFCYLGYIVALFSERSQALHDILASTLVLEPEQTPPQVEAPPSGLPPAAGS